MPGVIPGSLGHTDSLKSHKNLLEGVKDYSGVGNPSKGFQLEANCFVLFSLECTASSRTSWRRGSYTSKKQKQWETKYHIVSWCKSK